MRAPCPTARLRHAVGGPLLLVLSLLAAGARLAHAQGEVGVKAQHAILVDADSGATLFQRNADELIYPASMSKLMVLAMVFKALISHSSLSLISPALSALKIMASTISLLMLAG